MLNRVPIDKTALTCDVVRQVNAKIARGEHPEDGVFEAMVIAHTMLCESCRDHFHNEVQKVKEEKIKQQCRPSGD